MAGKEGPGSSGDFFEALQLRGRAHPPQGMGLIVPRLVECRGMWTSAV